MSTPVRRCDIGHLGSFKNAEGQTKPASDISFKNDICAAYNNLSQVLPKGYNLFLGISISGSSVLHLVFGDRFGVLVFVGAVYHSNSTAGLPAGFICMDHDNFEKHMVNKDSDSEPPPSSLFGSFTAASFLNDIESLDQASVFPDRVNFFNGARQLIKMFGKNIETEEGCNETFRLLRSAPVDADGNSNSEVRTQKVSDSEQVTVPDKTQEPEGPVLKKPVLNDPRTSGRLKSKDNIFYGDSTGKIPIGKIAMNTSETGGGNLKSSGKSVSKSGSKSGSKGDRKSEVQEAAALAAAEKTKTQAKQLLELKKELQNLKQQQQRQMELEKALKEKPVQTAPAAMGTASQSLGSNKAMDHEELRASARKQQELDFALHEKVATSYLDFALKL